jgi:1-acyl-sn-glycerol-3-phosphate acyltransferase
MTREQLYKLVHFLAYGLIKLEFRGTENIPQTGGVIFATNHTSRLDTPLLMLTPGRRDIIALAADKYKKDPLFKWILDSSGSIWIDRDRADFGAMRAALDFLRKGGAVGIAPEGTRSTTGSLQEAKEGVVFLAERARVPLIPIGIAGTDLAMKKILRLRKPVVTISYGKPVALPPMPREGRDVWQKQCTDDVMCRIASLLPPSYRGFYANHPRLAQYLENGG